MRRPLLRATWVIAVAAPLAPAAAAAPAQAATVRAGFAPGGAALRLDGPGLALRQRGAIVRAHPRWRRARDPRAAPLGPGRHAGHLRRPHDVHVAVRARGRRRPRGPRARRRPLPSRACASPSPRGAASASSASASARTPSTSAAATSRTTSPTGRSPSDTRPFVAARRSRPQGFRARDDATYYPVPWLLSSRGYGVLLDGDETSAFHLGTDPQDVWSVEVQAPRLAPPRLRRPDPRGTRCGASRRATGRQPAAAGAVAVRAVVPDRAAEHGAARRRGATWLEKLRDGRRAGVRRRDAAALPAVRRGRGNEDYEARRVAHFHAHGLARLTYVNPMVCVSLRAALRPGRRRRRAAAARRRRGRTRSLVRRRHRPAGFTIQPVAAVRLHAAGRRRAFYARVLKRGGRRRPRRLDGGLRRVHAARRAPARRHARRRDAQPLPDALPLRGAAAIARGARRPLVRFQRSGWTGAARCAAGRVGRRPDDDVRASTGSRSAVHAGARASACRALAAGAPTSAATTRSATTRS